MSLYSRLAILIVAVVACSPSGRAAEDGDKARTDLYGDPLPPGAIARLGSVRFHHPAALIRTIKSLAFSPDGKVLASASCDRVILWDRATGKRLREFKIDFCWSVAVGFAADGKLQVLRIEDRDDEGQTTQAVLLRPESKNDAVRLTLDDDCMQGVFAFSADGKRLLAAGKNKVAVWDVAKGKRIGEPVKLSQRLRAAALSADYRTAALVADEGRSIELMDLRTGKSVRRWNGIDEDSFGQIRGIAFSANGKTLFSTAGRMVRVWDTATGKLVRSMEGEDDVSTSLLAVSADGKTLATAGGIDDGKIILWDTAAGKTIPLPGMERERLDALAYTQPNRVVTISSLGLVHFWDAQSGKCLRTLGPKQGFVGFSAVSPRGEWLAGWTAQGRFAVWDVAAEKTRWRIKTPFTNIWPLRFSSDGKILMGLGEDGNESQFVCWDAATGKRLAPLATEIHASNCYLSRDGTTIALVTAQGFQRFRVRPNRTWRRLGEPVDSSRNRYVHDLSPDGRTLLVMGDEGKSLGLVEGASGTLIGWFVSGKSLRDPLIGYTAYSPDGSILAATVRGAVRLWDVATRKEVERSADNEFGALRVIISPDNQFVASEGSDNNVLIWKRRPPRVRDEPAHPSPVDVDALWSDLASAKAEVAWPAIRKLTMSPQQTVPFLKSHLSPARKGDTRRLPSLIADFDNDNYEVRQKAYRELEQEGERAEDALEEALEGQPSLELRKRVLELLEKREKARCERSPDNLRTIRAVQVLESINNAEARRVLKKLSESAGGALRTQEARAALRRLEK